MNTSFLPGLIGVMLFFPATEVATAADLVTFTAEDIFPESLTSTVDGTLYIGSARRTIYRARPGAVTAEPWIDTESSAPRSVFGVLADERGGVLYACTGTVGEFSGIPPQSTLYAFDLATGAIRRRFELPTPKAICNDIAVAPDGAVYVTDTGNAQILKLRGDRLEVWSPPGPFGDRQSVIDGIAVLGDRVLVNTMRTNRLISVRVQPDGSASAPHDIALDQPLNMPDGMRTWGKDALVIGENRQPGRVIAVRLSGDRGTVTELGTDLAHGSVAVTVVGEYVWYVAPHAYEPGPPKRFKAARLPLR
jgi:sugar lactone lactonase YvrE